MVQSMPLFIFFNINVCRMYRSMLEYAITISRRMLKKLVPVFAAGRRTESLGVRSGERVLASCATQSSPRAEKHGGRGAELRMGSWTPRLASGSEGPRPSGRH